MGDWWTLSTPSLRTALGVKGRRQIRNHSGTVNCWPRSDSSAKCGTAVERYARAGSSDESKSKPDQAVAIAILTERGDSRALAVAWPHVVSVAVLLGQLLSIPRQSR